MERTFPISNDDFKDAVDMPRIEADLSAYMKKHSVPESFLLPKSEEEVQRETFTSEIRDERRQNTLRLKALRARRARDNIYAIKCAYE